MNFGFRHFKNSSDCHKLKISLRDYVHCQQNVNNSLNIKYTTELKKKKGKLIFF
jgi:hypothetical protein